MAQKMTKARLKNYVWLIIEIDNQTERIERMDAELSSPASPSLDGMPRSNFAGNRMEEKMARKLELEDLRRANIKRAKKEAVAIEKAIQTIQHPRDRELMRLKYLEGLTWEETSERLHITLRWTHVLHGRILQNLP